MFVEAVLADDWSEETVDSRVATRDSYDPFEVPELQNEDCELILFI